MAAAAAGNCPRLQHFWARAGATIEVRLHLKTQLNYIFIAAANLPITASYTTTQPNCLCIS
jgi:hypothetical protein